MPRLVDADKLKKDVLDLPDCYNGFSDTYDKAMILALVDEQPTVEPKRGYWITWFEDEDVRQAKCSECGMMFTLGKGRDIHYCGNCGAKMDEVE